MQFALKLHNRNIKDSRYNETIDFSKSNSGVSL